MPINRAFFDRLNRTIQPVNWFVCPLSLCVLAVRPYFRVKKCKHAFHIFYTDIQNSILKYRSDL